MKISQFILSVVLAFSVSCKDQVEDDTSVKTIPDKGSESTNNENQNDITGSLNAALLEQGLDYASLYIEKDYDERITKVEEYESSNQKALMKIRDGKGVKLEEDVLKKEVPSNPINLNTLKKLVNSATDTQHLITIRQSDTQLTKIIINILKLLKNNDGKWDVSREGIVFESNESSEMFDNYIRKIQEVHLRQAEAQDN